MKTLFEVPTTLFISPGLVALNEPSLIKIDNQHDVSSQPNLVKKNLKMQEF